jgi:hypothetical protein
MKTTHNQEIRLHENFTILSVQDSSKPFVMRTLQCAAVWGDGDVFIRLSFAARIMASPEGNWHEGLNRQAAAVGQTRSPTRQIAFSDRDAQSLQMG